MPKIFRSQQIKNIDGYTIANEPVIPHALMERASRELFVRIASMTDRSNDIMVFAGTGNNGGDGLAVTRMMRDAGYRARAFVINISPNRSPEWETNLQMLRQKDENAVTMIDNAEALPIIPSEAVVIDAIFGSGLTRSPVGLAADAIRRINDSGAMTIAIDTPSGLPGEDSSSSDRSAIIRASVTLAIEFPRLSFMFSENHPFIGKWVVVPIGLHPVAIATTDTPFQIPDKNYVSGLLRRRSKFEHKGDYGHALLVAGSYGRMGAAILAARAALRSGAGLLTCHVPAIGYGIIQTAVPEAMAEVDKSDNFISDIINPAGFDAVGAGPGTGTETAVQKSLHALLTGYKGPMVLDADALNIIAMNPGWEKLLTGNTILTPHPKEFSRLAGETSGGYERLMRQVSFSGEQGCIVVLKGAHTSVSTPDGRVFFNNTGNPGMATAGSGDVLTGIILGLLAQGYSPEDAAVTGVFLHGLAGDEAAATGCMESVIASDIVANIHAAYSKVREDLL
ncbi:MAG: NAD(P)H-hydrate dehydratase [Bacteroidales bacterium]|jgi:NAD(P)H-hydrate epimerase|nr:NAD(P)H-hydrate dehydratase [Bacteroidales bacterium]